MKKKHLFGTLLVLLVALSITGISVISAQEEVVPADERVVTTNKDTAVYGFNLFDIVDEAKYKEYILRTMTEFASTAGMELIATGENPLRELSGKTRKYFAIMKFDSIEEFDRMAKWQKESGVKELHDAALTNYIWTIYETWDYEAWMKQGNSTKK